ncbi:UspA domain-containing protein [Mycobacterium tuberculosis]|nr:UspA domain-containing protein [Mycobacterium tuberculosis]
MSDRRGVVVGYDGSGHSEAAVRWAAEEARLRGAPLTVVHAWDAFTAVGPMAIPVADLRAAAQEIATEGAKLAREVTGADAHAALGRGGSTTALLEAASDADLVVVGSRGRGGFTGLVLGSTGLELAEHAPCPVVVVREPRATGPVVVGVDGSAASLEALGLAFAEAALRGAELAAVVAWPSDADTGGAPLVDADALREVARERLAGLVAPWRERYPQVPVRTEVFIGPPREVLLGAAKDARLLVVGSRGLGGFRGLLLGSVSNAVLQHAACPVAVAHAPRD